MYCRGKDRSQRGTDNNTKRKNRCLSKVFNTETNRDLGLNAVKTGKRSLEPNSISVEKEKD